MSEDGTASLPRGWFRRIKAEQIALIDYLGGVKPCMRLLGMSQGQTGNYRNRDHPALMPLHVVAMLEAEAGRLFVTAGMAEANGHRIAPDSCKDNCAGDESEVMRCNAELMGRVGQLAGAVGEALDDGELSANELRVITSHMAPLRDLLAKFDMALASCGDRDSVVKFKAGA